MKNPRPIKTWEIMGHAKDLFGLGYMARLLGIKSHSLVYRFCRNPQIITEEPALPNILDKSRQLAMDFMESGDVETTRAIAAMFAEICRCSLVCDDDIKPDKADVMEEIFDDYQKVASYHKSIKENKPFPIIDELCDAACRELRETKVKHFTQHLEGRR